MPPKIGPNTLSPNFCELPFLNAVLLGGRVRHFDLVVGQVVKVLDEAVNLAGKGWALADCFFASDIVSTFETISPRRARLGGSDYI